MRRAAILFFTLICGAFAGRANGAPANSLLHKPAPRFAREDLQHHQRVSLAAYKGKVVLLNFWATWCGPCLLELPQFSHWQGELGPKGLQVIAISIDDGADQVLSYTRMRPVPFPVVMGDEKLGRLYGGILGLPVTFLIDRDGRVAKRYQGESRLDDMEVEIRRLLDRR